MGVSSGRVPSGNFPLTWKTWKSQRKIVVRKSQEKFRYLKKN